MSRATHLNIVKKGQVWEHRERGKTRRVIVVQVMRGSVSRGKPYAKVRNLETGKITYVSLNRFTGHSKWRHWVITQTTMPLTPNPVAADATDVVTS